MLHNLRHIFKPPPKKDGFNVSNVYNYMYSIMVPLLLQGIVGIVYLFVIKDSSVLFMLKEIWKSLKLLSLFFCEFKQLLAATYGPFYRILSKQKTLSDQTEPS